MNSGTTQPVSGVTNKAQAPVNVKNRIGWMLDTDDLPHTPVDQPLWNETYLTYAYSPEHGVGVYWHLRHVPEKGKPGLWDVVAFVALPDDKYLVSKVVAPGIVDVASDGTGSLVIGGLDWRCESAWDRWVKRYRGGAQLVSGEVLRSGPLPDGHLIPIDIEIQIAATTPPWDHSTDIIQGGDIDWEVSKRHSEQHFQYTGRLTYAGKTIEMKGRGFRDHSWGPRNFTNMDHTTWIHGVKEDGTAFSATYVPGRNGGPDMIDPKICLPDRVVFTAMRNPPLSRNLEEAKDDAHFQLSMPDGRETEVHIKMLHIFPMHMLSPSEFVLGWPGPDSGHSHIDVGGFAQVEWDGETCLGYRESCVRIIP